MDRPAPAPTRSVALRRARDGLCALAARVVADGTPVVLTRRRRPLVALVRVEDLALLALLRARPGGAGGGMPAGPGATGPRLGAVPW